MITILGLSGSLREQSYNTALLRAAGELAGDAVRLDIATLHGIPLYDGDVEAREGLPAAVVALRERLLAADGLLLATPEYNNGMPGVLKNAIDWLSRPPADTAKVFGDRPTAVIGASPSGFGTLLAQTAWLPVLNALGVQLWAGGPRIRLSRAHQAFDASGALVDVRQREQLQQFIQGFAAFVRLHVR